MTVVDEYLTTLSGNEKETITHMVAVVRQRVPDATEELSYAMPAFKYKGKGLISIIANKNFMSVYPFCSVRRLGLDAELSNYECTDGSIHFTLDNPISDELLSLIILQRQALSDA